ncbi:MAG TPA: right-handed parallel beta-helix repeat-containing protein [Solirubrobacteraceae bacterium]|jgi:polygalacturonase
MYFSVGSHAATHHVSATFTPEQFGAIGNGKHNDTAAVQAAINAAAGRGMVLLSAHKTYLCTKALTIPSNSTIEGTNSTAVLSFNWFDASGSDSGGRSYIGSNVTASNSNITLTKFTVQGAGTGYPSGPNALYPTGLVSGVNLHFVNHFSIRHLQVRDVPGISIAYLGSQNGRIVYSYVHNSGRDGITGFGDSQNLDNIKIEHNDIVDVGDDAIAVNGAPLRPSVNAPPLPYNITVSNNIIQGWSTNINGKTLGRGIFIAAVVDVTVTNNSINNTFSSGIMVMGSQTLGIVVDKNPATHAPTRSREVIIQNNVITDAGQLSTGSTLDLGHGGRTDGIYIDGATSTVVSGNIITNSLSQAVDNVECISNCTVQ